MENSLTDGPERAASEVSGFPRREGFDVIHTRNGRARRRSRGGCTIPAHWGGLEGSVLGGVGGPQRIAGLSWSVWPSGVGAVFDVEHVGVGGDDCEPLFVSSNGVEHGFDEGADRGVVLCCEYSEAVLRRGWHEDGDALTLGKTRRITRSGH